MMENRPKQLASHIQGYLNVGGEWDDLKCALDELGSIAGEGYNSALAILNEVKENV